MELSAFRAAHSESVCDIDGREWRYIATSPDDLSAPALAMLPGAFGAAELFWNQMAALGNRLRMVSVTLPAAPEAPQLADGVMALADRLGLGRFSLLGTSLGGYIAQLIARDHSDRLETLFVANSLVCSEHLASLPDKATAEAASPQFSPRAREARGESDSDEYTDTDGTVNVHFSLISYWKSEKTTKISMGRWLKGVDVDAQSPKAATLKMASWQRYYQRPLFTHFLLEIRDNYQDFIGKWLKK